MPHRLARLRGRTNAGVDNDRQVDLVDENLDEVFGTQSLVAADGRTQRHDGSSTGICQTACCDQIRIHIGEHMEALLCQNFCGTNGLRIIRQQVLGIRNDLDLDEVTAAQLP